MSIEQLNMVPDQFKNNLVWNLGHMLITQQRLCYRMSGLDCIVEEDLIGKYSKGSKPTGFVSNNELSFIQEMLITSVDQLEKDYKDGLFKEYKTYPTSYGYELQSIDDAITFNNLHEGLHFGVIMAIKKLV